MLVTNNRVYLANFAVDMRKSIDGLVILVEDYFANHPRGCIFADGSYYVFCNKKKDKLKILYWDKSGFALWYKRLENACFNVSYTKGNTVILSNEELQWLLSGLDWQSVQSHRKLNYNIFR